MASTKSCDNCQFSVKTQDGLLCAFNPPEVFFVGVDSSGEPKFYSAFPAIGNVRICGKHKAKSKDE